MANASPIPAAAALDAFAPEVEAALTALSQAIRAAGAAKSDHLS
jgi:hypothetical protein